MLAGGRLLVKIVLQAGFPLEWMYGCTEFFLVPKSHFLCVGVQTKLISTEIDNLELNDQAVLKKLLHYQQIGSTSLV